MKKTKWIGDDKQEIKRLIKTILTDAEWLEAQQRGKQQLKEGAEWLNSAIMKKKHGKTPRKIRFQRIIEPREVGGVVLEFKNAEGGVVVEFKNAENAEKMMWLLNEMDVNSAFNKSFYG